MDSTNFEYRCDERIKTKTEESTPLAYTGLFIMNTVTLLPILIESIEVAGRIKGCTILMLLFAIP